MAIAIALLVIKGGKPSAEVVRPAQAVEVTQNQLFDMSAVNANAHTGATTSPNLALLQGDTLVPYQAVLTSMIDDAVDRDGNSTYEVQEGDNISQIAADYGLSVATLISANNIRNVNAIKPGTTLKIPPVDGVTYVVKKGDTISVLSKKYKADMDKIITYNNLPATGELTIGDELILPGGSIPKGDVAPATKGIASSRRFAGLPKFDGFYVTPGSGIITQLAHVRNGFDLAMPVGSPIYATAAGQVNFAAGDGWNHGYGKMIRITHANGTESLYGHLSKVLVVKGETVSQGQLIGYSGNTGHSTGPHLHFEMHSAYNILARYGMGGHVVALSH